MAGRLGKRVVHFPNLPIKLLMPNTYNNITEIALKTIPSASKIEIKRVLESLYGFEVEKVQTLNMDGKKKKRGGILIAKPDYKKAYVTLRNPLSISRDLFPIQYVEEEKRSKKKGSSFVEEEDSKNKHWLDGKDKEKVNAGGYMRDRGYAGNLKNQRGRRSGEGDGDGNRRSRGSGGGDAAAGTAKFPWSSMRSGR